MEMLRMCPHLQRVSQIHREKDWQSIFLFKKKIRGSTVR